MSFFHLCTLSRLLGDILPLVYTIEREEDLFQHQIRALEQGLMTWVDNLPPDLNYGPAHILHCTEGSSSLWFCFLSIKVLLCRLSLKVCLIR
jgi:hypothetical protein